MMRIGLLICLLLIPCFSLAAGESAEPATLRVYYLEFPPYYYTNHSHLPDGFLLKRATEIFTKAGISPRYQSMPAKCVLQNMRSSQPAASIGWFKTSNREMFAKYSLPIYKSEPLVALYLKKNESQFNSVDSLASLLKHKNLRLGLIDGYSLGNEVDQMVMEAAPLSVVIQGGYPQLVRLLASERFSYLLVAPEEVAELVSMNYLAPAQFGLKVLDDMPPGNMRYLMFTRGVNDEIVGRVNKAIEQLGY